MEKSPEGENPNLEHFPRAEYRAWYQGECADIMYVTGFYSGYSKYPTARYRSTAIGIPTALGFPIGVAGSRGSLF